MKAIKDFYCCWCLYLFTTLSTTKIANSLIIKSACYNSFALENIRIYNPYSFRNDRRTKYMHQTMTNAAGPDDLKSETTSLSNFNKNSNNINTSSIGTENISNNEHSQMKQRPPSNLPPIIALLMSLCTQIYYKVLIFLVTALMNIRIFRVKAMSSFRLSRKWITRSVLVTGLLVLLQRIIAFTNSLVLEISFANFLRLLKESPERIKHLRVE